MTDDEAIREAAEAIILGEYEAALVVIENDEGTVIRYIGGRTMALGLAEHARQALGPQPVWSREDEEDLEDESD